jgi:hypothetical protein
MKYSSIMYSISFLCYISHTLWIKYDLANFVFFLLAQLHTVSLCYRYDIDSKINPWEIEFWSRFLTTSFQISRSVLQGVFLINTFYFYFQVINLYGTKLTGGALDSMWCCKRFSRNVVFHKGNLEDCIS